MLKHYTLKTDFKKKYHQKATTIHINVLNFEKVIQSPLQDAIIDLLTKKQIHILSERPGVTTFLVPDTEKTRKNNSHKNQVKKPKRTNIVTLNSLKKNQRKVIESN